MGHEVAFQRKLSKSSDFSKKYFFKRKDYKSVTITKHSVISTERKQLLKRHQQRSRF